MNTRLIDVNKKAVKISNFEGLEYGDCYYSSDGSLCVKIDMYEAFNFSNGEKEEVEDEFTITPASVEIKHFAIT